MRGTKYNYGWALWIGNLRISWVKPAVFSYDRVEDLFFIRIGHIEISNASY